MVRPTPTRQAGSRRDPSGRALRRGRSTKAEEDLLDDSAAVMFFERSDGIVETDWFENRQEALEEWAEIQEEFEEGDD